MKWTHENFGREQCQAPHRWANRALAVPLDDGDVVLAEVCTRCGLLRFVRKSGTAHAGMGSRPRG